MMEYPRRLTESELEYVRRVNPQLARDIEMFRFKNAKPKREKLSKEEKKARVNERHAQRKSDPEYMEKINARARKYRRTEKYREWAVKRKENLRRLKMVKP